MKRFALVTCLAACLVFALGTVAFGQADLVAVGSASGGIGASVTVGISLTNSLSSKTVIIPIVIRSQTNGAYPTTIQGVYNDGGRLDITTGAPRDIIFMNVFDVPNGTCNGVDGFAGVPVGTIAGNSASHPGPTSDPDAIVFIRNKIAQPSLAPGTDATPSINLNFTNPGDTGCYIIDTTCNDPANHLIFISDGNVNVAPAFTSGQVCTVPNQCPVNLAVSSNPVNATVGSQASATVSGTDPENDTPVEFFLVSGPGSVDQSTGEWTYTPDCGDLAGFTVEVEVTDKGEGGCTSESVISFDVNVSPTALNIGCSNVSVLWSGADAAQTVNVSGGCPPYTYGVDLGSIDGSGNWSYDQGCGDLGVTQVNVDVMDDAGQQIACQFNLTVTNTAPTCSNPPDLTAPTGVPFNLVLGPATDGDGESLTYNAVGLPAWASVVGNAVTGTRPGADPAPYAVTFSATDGCETSADCSFNILFESPFVVCFDDGDALNGQDEYVQTLGGRLVQICVWVDPSTGSSAGVGGFDFLICYDQSGLVFQNAYRGPDLHEDWEYFTWRTGMFGGNCGGACPDGFVRLVGIADMNNGITPDPATFGLAGSIACLEFWVTDDQNFTNSCLHVGFCTYDCGDNVISSKDGNSLFLINSGGAFGPDYDQEFCIDDTKDAEAEPFIDVCEGAICIIPPPDDRGDLNLNGIPNEIADAVLYSRFFIFGASVWDPNPANAEVQVFASDVNNDGITLTVADLIYLIRIITGDAQPFDDENVNPKVAPYANSVSVVSDNKGGALTVTTNTSVDLGGAVLVYRYTDLSIGEPIAIDGMTVKARAANGELRVLISPDVELGGRVPAGTNDLLTIPVEGQGSIELVESQFADANGALLEVNALAKAVPTSFALHQNFPNPFNAGTVIPVTLSQDSDWSLTIYNVAGQVVKTFGGHDVAGNHSIRWDGRTNDGVEASSGMYFYQFKAADYNMTRKMVILK